MTFRIIGGLPYVSVVIRNDDQTLLLENVVLDTGAAVSIFDSDVLAKIGIFVEPNDPIHEVRGVGGVELVIVKCIDELQVGGLKLPNFCIDMGPMEYGFPIDGLLGSDFLELTGAIIDYRQMRLY